MREQEKEKGEDKNATWGVNVSDSDRDRKSY
jgi:hypothetical protein